MSTLDFWELPDSGGLDETGQRIQMKYALSGTDDKLAVLAHVAQNTDLEISGVPRKNIRARVYPGHYDLWDIVVVYAYGSAETPGGPNPSDIGEERESWTTRGERIHITQAIQHIDDFPESTEENPVPNHGGTINVTPEKIEGVDIDNAGFSFVVRKLVESSAMTTGYRQALFTASNRVNSATWRGFQPGELRLVSVEANQRDSESWELTFQFQAIQNVENQTIGGIEGVSKLGHEYIWGEYETQVVDDNGVKSTRKVLQSLHVEQVYKLADFNVLGLDP